MKDFIKDDIKEQVKLMPNLPGCYQYFDEKGEVIYVGKAKNLSKRVRSYFVNHKNKSPKLEHLVPKIAKIECIVVDSEIIVPGDIIILEAGDKVPADARIIEETNLTVDVIYNDGDLKCKVYGKGYNYTLSTKNTTTKNNKDGYDVYYGTSQGTPNSMVNAGGASNKSDTYTTISTTQSGTGAVKGNYSKTYTHSCTITAAEYSPGAQGSSECKQTNFQGTYTKKNEMFCKDGKYAKLTGTDLDKAFCKADDEDYDKYLEYYEISSLIKKF